MEDCTSIYKILQRVYSCINYDVSLLSQVWNLIVVGVMMH